MSKVRLRRLTADYEHLCEYAHSNPRVELVQAVGNPPEKYQVCYQINSLRKEVDSDPAPAMRHMVEIVLPRDYPRTPPLCRMLTSVFHPNIAPHAICIGDHWNAGEPLWSMVSRIGEMLAYQSFNVKSPLNGEAARWAEKNMDKIPLDTVCMIPATPPGSVEGVTYPKVAPVAAPIVATTVPSGNGERVSHPTADPIVAKVVAPPAPKKPAVSERSTSTESPPSQPPENILSIFCPGCEARFHIRHEQQGKKFRCPKCKTIFS